MLFKEAPFLERFERAARTGFRAVEFWHPAAEDFPHVEADVRASGVEVVLFNLDAGDMPSGDRGLISDPDRQDAFRDSAPHSVELARALGCPRLNALAGLRLPALDLEEQLTLAAESVRWVAALAHVHEIIICIEPVNTFENGPYLLPTTADALAFIERVGAPNVRLQYDVYHSTRMGDDPAAVLREHFELVEHVQVADAPGRGQPGSGTIDFDVVFELLVKRGYAGYVGLEYNPAAPTTEESLEWLPREARGGEANAR